MSTENLTTKESAPSTPSLLTSSARGTGRAFGAASELVSGTNEDGVIFNLTLPLQAVSTVDLRVRPAKETVFKGLDDAKATTAVLEYALNELGLKAVDLTARRKTMILGKLDFNYREADAVAALYALYAALELPLEASEASRMLHSALGAPSGLGAPAFKTMALLDSIKGTKLASFPEFPRLAYVVIRPKKTTPREGLLPHPDHQSIFDQALKITQMDVEAIGQLSTRSAQASHESAPHALGDFLLGGQVGHVLSTHGLDAPLGVALNSSSHGAAILFDESRDGRATAVKASSTLRQELGEDYWMGISFTHPNRSL